MRYGMHACYMLMYSFTLIWTGAHLLVSCELLALTNGGRIFWMKANKDELCRREFA